MTAATGQSVKRLFAAASFTLAFLPAPTGLPTYVRWALLAPLVLCIAVSLSRSHWPEVPRRMQVSLAAFLTLLSISAFRGETLDSNIAFICGVLFAVLGGIAISTSFSTHAFLLGLAARTLWELASQIALSGLWPGLSMKLGDAGSYHLLVAALLLPALLLSLNLPGWRAPAASAACLLALSLTRSRSALLAAGAGLIAFGLIRFSRPPPKRLVPIAAGLLICVAAVLFVRWTWKDALRTIGPRYEYAGVAADAIIQSPALGIGWGSFVELARERGVDPPALDPHNLYLHIAVEAGLPALAAFILAVAWSKPSPVAGAAICAIAVYSLFVSFYLDWPLFWTLLALREGTRDAP